jgi:hypothetical protein
LGRCFPARQWFELKAGIAYPSNMRSSASPAKARIRVPEEFRRALLPVARRVFWWGTPKEWLDDPIRFGAQVMTFGDWNDTALVAKLLGESFFEQVLDDPPPGVFDIKSWNYWHLRYRREVPSLPTRKL